MKIRAVETVVVGARMRNWVFVKVETDEPGLTGWGESTLEWKTQGVVGAIADLAPLLVGQDPFRIEHLWQSMTRHQYWQDGVIGMSAVSGVDMALHDIKGQALGVPVHQLVGGPVRDHIRCYTHLGGGDPDAVYGQVDSRQFTEHALECVNKGFTALKFLPLPVGSGLPEATRLSVAVGVVEAVRDAVGGGVDIMLDLHGRATAAMAVAFGRAVADQRPWFLEEPVPPQDIRGLARVCRDQPIPVATGERLVRRDEHEVALRAGVQVLQPDLCHCGGYSGMLRAALLAEGWGVHLAPHNPLGPIATTHNLHVAAATPNWLVQEQMIDAVPWLQEVVTTPIEIERGVAPIPANPGLGTAVDERVAARHQRVNEPQPRAVGPDGAVLDW